jgi:hypothetical protein
MTSLIDIAKRRVTVPVQGVDIPVQGIGADGLVYLMERFPQFRALIFPSEVGQEGRIAASPVLGQPTDAFRAVRAPTELSDPPSMMSMFPEALPAILAAGTGHIGEVDHEEAARGLGAHDQIELLDKIMELTMPQGIVAFLERLTGLFGAVGRQPSLSENEPTSSPNVPNGKAPDMQSQSASSG